MELNRTLTKAERISFPRILSRLSVVEGKNVQPVAIAETKDSMTKAIAALLILAMIAQIIKPLGLPGLMRRGDFWKIALFAFAIWSAALILREFTTL